MAPTKIKPIEIFPKKNNYEIQNMEFKRKNINMFNISKQPKRTQIITAQT